MKWLGLRISSILIILSTALSASAGEIYEFYNGVRSLGMGGAYVTVVNDETAIFTNPAGLGKLRDVFVTIADPELDVSAQLTDFFGLDNAADVFAVQGLLDTLNENKGKHFHARFQISPSIVLTNFGIGTIAKYTIDGEVDETGTTYKINYTNDYGAVLAYNFRLFNGIIKLGVNGKLINRVEVDEELAATSTNLELKDLAAEGVGISTDVGLIITAPIRYLPSIGAVVRDVGGTSFHHSDGFLMDTGDRRPAFQRQKLDAGFSISPILGNRIRATLTGEVHDLMTDDELEAEDIMRRVHGGLELNMADFFFLRGGMNQKFWTAGFEIASTRFQLQGATYGEDVGTPNDPREDRRFVGKFSIRF